MTPRRVLLPRAKKPWVIFTLTLLLVFFAYSLLTFKFKTLQPLPFRPQTTLPRLTKTETPYPRPPVSLIDEWMSYYSSPRRSLCPALTSQMDPDEALQFWESNCENKVSQETSFIGEMISTLYIKFPPPYPNWTYQYVTFNHSELKGLFLLKDKKPRPLIIVRGGIGSSPLDFRTERFLLIQLMESTNHHILFIGSSINDDHLSKNSFAQAGSLFEAQQNAWLIENIQSTHDSSLFTSIHLIGLSMSGLGVWLTPHFLKESKPLESLVLMCPYIEQNPHLISLYQDPVKKFLIENWAKKRFEKTLLKKNSLDNHLPWIFQQIGQSYSKQEWLSQGPPHLQGFFGNDYWNTLKELKKQSHPKDSIKNKWLILSKKDPLVPIEENGLQLKSTFPYLKTTLLNEGYHCAWKKSYPSQDLGHLFQVFFNSHNEP